MNKILLFLFCVFSFSSLNAQQFVDQGTKIAYVNADRTQILSVKADSAPKVILASTGQIKVSHLAVLASTHDGKALLIAGQFNFLNPHNSQPDSLLGFIKLVEPFTLVGGLALDSSKIGGQRVLYRVPVTLEEPGFVDVRKPLPIGALSPNEQDWYGHWAKNGAATNSFEFYHGKFDGTTKKVDIGTLPDGNSGLPDHEYHMTNICADNQGTMLCVVMDRLTQEDDQLRARLWRWSQGIEPQLKDLNSIRAERTNWHMDSSFICLLRVVPGQPNPTAEIGLMPNDVGNIIFYNFRYDEASPALTPNGRTIPRSVLDDSIFFFTGITGNPLGPNDNMETIANMMRHVNGGDMMFSETGDSVVFITSNALTPAGAADWAASPERSGIWIYDIAKEWPKAKFVYNDKTKMERQPIFMGQVWVEAPPPTPGTITVDKTSLDFGSHYVTGDTKTLGVVITNPGKNDAEITSFEISGAQELDYANMGTNPINTTPFTVAENQSVTLNIKFDPSAVGTRNAKLTIHFANKPDSIREVSLTGIGLKDTTGAVDPEDLSAFGVTIRPNPMLSNATIGIQYDGREDLTFSLVDVLGREYVLTNAPQTVFGGESASFEFSLDSRKSGLAPGSYTLYVRNGARTIARQIVVVN